MFSQMTRALAVLMLTPLAAAAQPLEPPAAAAELSAGYAGFADDGTIGHGVFGGGIRFHLSPRVSVGPELQYMIGPGEDRDLILTGNVVFDVLPPDRRATPFFVAGGGLFNHSDAFGSSTEGAFTAGAGVRAWLSERVYAAAEMRFGWELHYRFTGTVGVALTR